MDDLVKENNYENQILCGDSIELVKQLPDNSVHLILSDIPYGIGLDDWDVLHDNKNSAYGGNSPAQDKAGKVFRKRGKPINGWSEADRQIPIEYYNWCSMWASEWLRVIKPGGSVFVFAGRRYAHRCISALEDSGFNFRDLLGWVRERAVHRAQRLSVVYDRRGDDENSVKWGGWRVGNLKPSFEPIIWAFKPYKITIADNVLDHEVGAYNQEVLMRYFGKVDNIFECSPLSGDKGLHDAQKPLNLMEALVELVTLPGQTVLDPFAGSGTTALAAKNLGRNYIVFEQSQDLCDIIRNRIETKSQIKLF